MKNSIYSFLATGVLVCSLGACSSTNTETGTATTTEPVSTSAPSTQAAASDPDATSTPAMGANSFVTMAASSDMFEVQSADLARTRALHPAVRVYAKVLRDDQGKGSKELESLAAKKNITLPTTMLPEHQRLLAPLSEANIGEKFDKRFMNAQITIQRRDDQVLRKRRRQ